MFVYLFFCVNFYYRKKKATIASDFFFIDGHKEALLTEKSPVIFKCNHVLRVTVEKFFKSKFFYLKFGTISFATLNLRKT